MENFILFMKGIVFLIEQAKKQVDELTAVVFEQIKGEMKKKDNPLIHE